MGAVLRQPAEREADETYCADRFAKVRRPSVDSM